MSAYAHIARISNDAYHPKRGIHREGNSHRQKFTRLLGEVDAASDRWRLGNGSFVGAVRIHREASVHGFGEQRCSRTRTAANDMDSM